MRNALLAAGVLLVTFIPTSETPKVRDHLDRSVPAVVEDYPVGDKPFRRYIAEGRDRQRIIFYLSTQQAPAHPVPLIVWVQGTGCSSQFVSVGGRMSRGLQGVLDSVARGRARILAVEKPGVEFLDDPADESDASTCRPQFRDEYTLDR